jgi:CRP-like cAMP-binding protein
VNAVTAARLVALPGPAFNELLRDAPEVERRVRRASHDRLSRL